MKTSASVLAISSLALHFRSPFFRVILKTIAAKAKARMGAGLYGGRTLGGVLL